MMIVTPLAAHRPRPSMPSSPIFSYARSDKKDQPRISITGRLIADLLATAGANQWMTMTLHSPQVHGFFQRSLPITSQRTQNSSRHFRCRDLTNTVIVAPDIGHAKRAAKLASALGVGVAAGIRSASRTIA